MQRMWIGSSQDVQRSHESEMSAQEPRSRSSHRCFAERFEQTAQIPSAEEAQQPIRRRQFREPPARLGLLLPFELPLTLPLHAHVLLCPITFPRWVVGEGVAEQQRRLQQRIEHAAAVGAQSNLPQPQAGQSDRDDDGPRLGLRRHQSRAHPPAQVLLVVGLHHFVPQLPGDRSVHGRPVAGTAIVAADVAQTQNQRHSAAADLNQIAVHVPRPSLNSLYLFISLCPWINLKFDSLKTKKKFNLKRKTRHINAEHLLIRCKVVSKQHLLPHPLPVMCFLSLHRTN